MSINSSDSLDYSSLINELVPDDCPCSYCFLKFYLSHCQPDRRMLVQLKCIEKFKWDRSEQNGHNCGWESAVSSWVEQGYAEAFARCYSSLLHVDDIYAHCKEMVKDPGILKRI